MVTSAPWHGSVDGRRLPATLTGKKAAGCAFSRKRKRTSLGASAHSRSCRRIAAPISKRASFASCFSLRSPFARRNSGADAWSAQIHRAALSRVAGLQPIACGAIDAVHIESAAACEKTCACVAISGSFQNSLETPDSFAWGAARASGVGFQPTEEMATAREQAPRWTFARVAEMRPFKEMRSSSRSVRRRARLPTPHRARGPAATAKRGDRALRKRIGASEDLR